jgi:hypothetical protein
VGHIVLTHTHLYMMTGIELLLSVSLLLVIISLYYGTYGNMRMEVLVEINMLDSPYYNLGVSYDRTYEDLYQCVDRLTIGLVLVNFNVLFHKYINA